MNGGVTIVRYMPGTNTWDKARTLVYVPGVVLPLTLMGQLRYIA